MNRDVAHRYLSEYWALVDQARKLPTLSKERRATAKAVNEHLATVNHILRTLAPDLKLINANWIRDHVAAWPQLRRALALLAGWQEMVSHQWTGGGPALPLKLLDPVVFNAAEP